VAREEGCQELEIRQSKEERVAIIWMDVVRTGSSLNISGGGLRESNTAPLDLQKN